MKNKMSMVLGAYHMCCKKYERQLGSIYYVLFKSDKSFLGHEFAIYKLFALTPETS